MEIDQAFQLVGEYGKIQQWIFWSMAIPQLFVAWNHLLNVFVGATPEFFCNLESKIDHKTSTTVIKGCSPDPVNSPCQSYSFAENDFTSIASEWQLVCSSAYQTDLAQSIFMVGLLVGNLLGGYFADSHGRKPVCYVGVLGLFFFGMLAITASSYQQYVLIRFIAGLLCGAYGLVSFTLPAEIVGGSYRGYVNVVTSITFALGISTLPLLAYYIRDWRMLSFVTAFPGLLGIAYIFYLPESPRWLLTQGRIEEAETIITEMWKGNLSSSSFTTSKSGKGCLDVGCKSDDDDDDDNVKDQLRYPHQPHIHHRITLKTSQKSAAASIANRTGLADIFCNVKLFKITLNNIFTWFVANMTYYGLNFKMGDLNGNKYINVVLSGLVEIPACLLTFYFMDRSGRKVTYTWTLFLSSAVCLAITMLSEVTSSFSTFLALLGKTSISMTVCVCWMHAAEMYPTNIRNKAMSLCSMSGRFGGVVAPMILALGRYHHGLDFFIFGFLSLISGLISLKLPETLNRSLPETIDDLNIEISIDLIDHKTIEVTKLISEAESGSVQDRESCEEEQINNKLGSDDNDHCRAENYGNDIIINDNESNDVLSCSR